MNNSGFSWEKRAKSFVYAWNGIKLLVSGEHNARIHCVVAVAVVISGLLLEISSYEWIAIVLCIGGVLACEGFNSAIEALADKISPDFDSLIGRAKDIAAGSVLLFVVASVVVGLIVFIPKLIKLC